MRTPLYEVGDLLTSKYESDIPLLVLGIEQDPHSEENLLYRVHDLKVGDIYLENHLFVDQVYVRA